MIVDLARDLLQFFHDKRYENDEGQPIKLVIGLDNGVVCRGHVVSAERWLKLNMFGSSGPKVGFDNVSGAWPTGFNYAPSDGERFTTVYLTMVEFLSGGGWVSGCSIAVNAEKIIFLGDQYS